MIASELAEQLMKTPNMDVMILDGFNGGGEPRTINFGPVERVITSKNEKEGADCEGRVGETVLLIGYGCY